MLGFVLTRISDLGSETSKPISPFYSPMLRQTHISSASCWSLKISPLDRMFFLPKAAIQTKEGDDDSGEQSCNEDQLNDANLTPGHPGIIHLIDDKGLDASKVCI